MHTQDNAKKQHNRNTPQNEQHNQLTTAKTKTHIQTTTTKDQVVEQKPYAPNSIRIKGNTKGTNKLNNTNNEHKQETHTTKRSDNKNMSRKLHALARQRVKTTR